MEGGRGGLIFQKQVTLVTKSSDNILLILKCRFVKTIRCAD